MSLRLGSLSVLFRIVTINNRANQGKWIMLLDVYEGFEDITKVLEYFQVVATAILFILRYDSLLDWRLLFFYEPGISR